MKIKNKVILIAIITSCSFVILIFLFFAGSGGGTQLVPTDEENAKEYKKVAFELGTDWEIALIINTFDADFKRENNYVNINYLYAQLNCCQIKEDIYEEWVEKDDDGHVVDRGWDLVATNYYNGADEIFNYLEIPTTEKNVDAVVQAVESKNRIYYDGNRARDRMKAEVFLTVQIFDITTLVTTYYPELEDNLPEMLELYESHYFMQLYESVTIDDIEAGINVGSDYIYNGNITFDSTIGGNASAWATTKLGANYSQDNRWGANSFDCSSLVYRAYQAVGINISYGGSTTAASIAQGLEVRGCQIGYNEIAPGDLIFYSTKVNKRYKNITHVSMYIGDNTIVHAKGKAYGVVLDPSTYNKSKIVSVARPSGLQ